MSADSVDDLHQAEDILGQHNLLGGYCRPTCSAEGPREDCESDEDCGCPCHDREPTPLVIVTKIDDGDNEVSFTCPKCGVKDRIVEQDTGIRWSDVHRAELVDDVLVIKFNQDDLGTFEGDGYVCRDCGANVDFPHEVETDYVG